MSRMETSSGSLSAHKRMHAGVEIPKGQEWAKHLVESLDGLDSYQKEITSILENLQKEDPSRVLEIARKIGNFFSEIATPGQKFTTLHDFLESIKKEIETSRNGKLN